MQPEVIAALDVPDRTAAEKLVTRLPAELIWVKIGLELFCAEGPPIIAAMRERGKRVFLDLKFHDIPRTAARAVTAAGKSGASLMTVHAAGGTAMLRAAAEAAAAIDPAPRLVAVTTLTSLDVTDMENIGMHADPLAQSMRLAELALNNGIDGVVSAVQEAAGLRERFGPRALLVTPGIRMAGESTGDQKRVATPAMAVQEGASFLVVGRSISAADDPHEAAMRILNETARAAADLRG